MNLRDLKYLVALADTRHFGKAAERCFVSQPTLSAQIKKLEDYLGVPLVERQPRNVALTAAGEEVVERARRVIRDTDDIVDLAHLSRDPLAGKLRIGLIPTIGPYLLPHVMLKLRKAFANVRSPVSAIVRSVAWCTERMEMVPKARCGLRRLQASAAVRGLDIARR